jgi:hypothetical protein
MDGSLYNDLIAYLQNFGVVLTEHVGIREPDPIGPDPVEDSAIHDRDMKWLSEAAVLIAEVTQPSIGVGYEIGRAVEKNIPVLCLFRPEPGRHLSAMITGSPYVNVVEYSTIEEAQSAIRLFFNNCFLTG